MCERFNHEKLFVEDLKLNVTLISFTNGIKHKELREKFIIAWAVTSVEAIKVVEMCT